MRDSNRIASGQIFLTRDGFESGGDVSSARSAQPRVPGGTPAPEEEVELVRRAQHHDAWAADQLVRRYQKKVYGIAYRLCGFDAEEACDMTQEAFLLAFRNITQFEGRSRFSTWLYRVAVNACLDARRRRRRWMGMILSWRGQKEYDQDPPEVLDTIGAPENGSDPVASVSGAELQRDVLKALRRLSEQQRTVFQLKIFQEMSIAEIALVTGLAEGTVKSHLFRATQRMREQLHRWVER
jgi:RNA polymerase sigma-70 factor (ECF subfamily)